MYYSPVRHSFGQASLAALVRLACIRHAASVYPEPGSNSSFDFSSPESFTQVFFKFVDVMCFFCSVFKDLLRTLFERALLYYHNSFLCQQFSSELFCSFSLSSIAACFILPVYLPYVKYFFSSFLLLAYVCAYICHMAHYARH